MFKMVDGRKTDDDGFQASSASKWPDSVMVKVTVDGASMYDSHDPTKAKQVYDRDAWQAFLDGVNAGEFNLPPLSASDA
jgi:hypothetical protein